MATQKSTKYTPGPWRPGEVTEDGTCWKAFVLAKSRTSALDIAPLTAGGRTPEEALANVRLGAAALELLDMCRILLGTWPPCGLVGPPEIDAIRREARAVIAKAEG